MTESFTSIQCPSAPRGASDRVQPVASVTHHGDPAGALVIQGHQSAPAALVLGGHLKALLAHHGAGLAALAEPGSDRYIGLALVLAAVAAAGWSFWSMEVRLGQRDSQGLPADDDQADAVLLDEEGEGTFFEVADGIDYAVNFTEGGERPIKVINMSLGTIGAYLAGKALSTTAPNPVEATNNHSAAPISQKKKPRHGMLLSAIKPCCTIVTRKIPTSAEMVGEGSPPSFWIARNVRSPNR